MRVLSIVQTGRQGCCSAFRLATAPDPAPQRKLSANLADARSLLSNAASSTLDPAVRAAPSLGRSGTDLGNRLREAPRKSRLPRRQFSAQVFCFLFFERRIREPLPHDPAMGLRPGDAGAQGCAQVHSVRAQLQSCGAHVHCRCAHVHCRIAHVQNAGAPLQNRRAHVHWAVAPVQSSSAHVH
jgi:hypothetical protein